MLFMLCTLVTVPFYFHSHKNQPNKEMWCNLKIGLDSLT